METPGVTGSSPLQGMQHGIISNLHHFNINSPKSHLGFNHLCLVYATRQEKISGWVGLYTDIKCSSPCSSRVRPSTFLCCKIPFRRTGIRGGFRKSWGGAGAPGHFMVFFWPEKDHQECFCEGKSPQRASYLLLSPTRAPFTVFYLMFWPKQKPTCLLSFLTWWKWRPPGITLGFVGF